MAIFCHYLEFGSLLKMKCTWGGILLEITLFLLPSTVFTPARQTLFTIAIQFLSLR